MLLGPMQLEYKEFTYGLQTHAYSIIVAVNHDAV